MSTSSVCGIDRANGKDRTVITCLSIDCPERTGGECNANQSVAYTASSKDFDVFLKNLKKTRKYKIDWIKIRMGCLLFRVLVLLRIIKRD